MSSRTVIAGKYALQYELGRGGFGVTYLAIDVRSGSQVALKAILIDSQGKLNSVLQEFSRIKQLNHNGIVKVYDCFALNGLAYICMEFIKGKTLLEITQGHSLPARQVLHYVAEAGSALKTMHDRGLIHRDVKPQNIMITPDDHVVLIDFGGAREFSESTIVTQTVIYTQGFSAPEQFMDRAQRGAFTDVYALAVTCFVLITGDFPQLDHNGKIRNGNKLSLRVRSALERALIFDPSRRTRNMTNFARDLGIRLSEPPRRRTPSIQPMASAGRTKPGRQLTSTEQDRRNRPSFLLFTIAVISVYGLLWFLVGTMVYRGQRNSSRPQSSINSDAFAAMIFGLIAFISLLYAQHWFSSTDSSKMFSSLYSLSNVNSNFISYYVASVVAAIFGAWIEHKTNRS